MLLRQVGELGLLREIRRRFSSPGAADGRVVVGIGDDAAAFSPDPGMVLVTTDLMAEGVHFDLDLSSPLQVGFKLVSVNVSDIMAMGGRPRHLFLSLALRETCDDSFFRDLFEGIAAACDRYGVSLLGGDLSGSRNDLVLNATLVGSAGSVVTRGRASPGDRIYVTGMPGDAACGLELLRAMTEESREMVKALALNAGRGVADRAGSRDVSIGHGRTASSLAWEQAGPLLSRHLTPVARDSSAFAAGATAMIDLSDGLFIDLTRVCDESGCGARVYLDRIPLSEEMKKTAVLLGLDPLALATRGGEDYELLFTSPGHIGGAAGRDFAVTCVGEITDGERTVVASGGGEFPLKAEGYQHFGAQG